MKDRRKWLWIAVIAILAWICAKGARNIVKAATGKNTSSGTIRNKHLINYVLIPKPNIVD